MVSACDALQPGNDDRGSARGVATIETDPPRTEDQHPPGAVQRAEGKSPLPPTKRYASPPTTAAAPAVARGDAPCAPEGCALADDESLMRQGPDESGNVTSQRDATSPHAPLIDGKQATTSRCASGPSGQMEGPHTPREEATSAAILADKRIQKILTKKPGDEGFSLVELVVVIAVLATLCGCYSSVPRCSRKS